MFDILDVTCSAKRQNWCPTTRPPTQSGVDMWRTACHRPLVGADAAAEWFEAAASAGSSPHSMMPKEAHIFPDVAPPRLPYIRHCRRRHRTVADSTVVHCGDPLNEALDDRENAASIGSQESLL